MAVLKAASVEKESSTRQRFVQAGVGVALVGLLAIWYFLRANPQVAKVREMQQELFAKSLDKMAPEQRKESFEALRAERDKLSEEERKDLRKEMGQQFQNKMSAEAVAYLKMTPAERLKFVDQKLAREQAMSQFKGGGKGGFKGAGPNGGGAGAPPTGTPKGPNVVAANSGTGGGAAVTGGPGGPGGPGGKGPSTPEDRDNRRREMLIHSTAEARAGMDQMRLDMATRRAQLGLPMPQGKGPR